MCFEASWAVLWSLSCYKKLKLTTKPFTGHQLGAFWSRCKILACEVRACTERKIWVFGFKSDIAVLTFTFRFLSSAFLCFSCLIFLSLAGHYSRLHFGGKNFRKAFRILGLDERKDRRVVKQDFHGNLQVNVAWFFAFFSGVLDWIVFILVWFERSLHSAQVSGWRLSCPWPLKLTTSQAVERTWIRTGGYGQLRGEWVNNFILATKLTELIEDVRWCILLQVKFDLRWLLNLPLATGL